MNIRKPIKSLEFKDLSFELNAETVIFENISFDFPLNGIIWVKSEAGAGKSSLFRILDGLTMASSGSYEINGECISDMSVEEFNQYRLSMGYSFDFGGLINNRSLYQNLSLPLEYHNISDAEGRDQKVKYMLDAFGIETVADKRPSSVPGSIRKAMCVARAFIHEPQVVFLDDPTTGLRGDTKAQLRSVILKHIEKHPNSVILIATEDEKFINGLAHEKIELKKDKLVLESLKEKAA